MKCNCVRLAFLVLGLLSISAWAPPAGAVPAVFFDRDDATSLMTSFPNSQAKFNQFTATLSTFGVDNVDAAAGVNPTLAFGATGITAATQGVLAQAAPTFQIGTQALVELDAVAPGQVDTVFGFNQYITAFGIFVIQGGDGQNSNPTTFRLRDTATNLFVDVPVPVGPGWGNNNVFFLGVGDTVPFNEVSIIETGDIGDGMLYDNIVAGTYVPEPGSLVLLTLGGAFALSRAIHFRRRVAHRENPCQLRISSPAR
jgi:hypothetical protein